MTDSHQERYVLQRKLGAGAMGDVWLASDTLLNRLVAIKYLKATQDTTPKKFFLSEAQMLASLNHPNITLIYDAVFDEQQSKYYLVMEYVEGRPLSNLIDSWSGPLPLEIILDVTIGILEALKYAHEKGVVHRDIKPENVLIRTDGVKLTDFGVAGLISLLTEGDDLVAGTPAYMSPEQIQGVAIDGRADLYSLGIMLFELVTGGRRPFESKQTLRVFEAHMLEAPPSLKELAPNIPLALERTITRLLAKEPDDRFASADALLDIFDSIQARNLLSQPHLQLLDAEARPLVGRSDELEQMEAIWAKCRESAKSRLLIVQGEMGIGKSRLIAEFLGQYVVDEGFIAVVGRSDESGIPYAPFVEILGTVLNKGLAESAAVPGQVDQLIAHMPSLARLLDLADEPAAKEATDTSSQLPAIRTGLWSNLRERVADSDTADLSEAEREFFTVVLTLLNGFGPAAVYLEDATLLDNASVALVRFLIRQRQLSLLFIAACRNSDGARSWFDSISTDEKVIINLPPLTTPMVRNYVINLIGGPVPDDIAEVIRERSGGIPLHIEEITDRLIEAKELELSEDDGTWRYTPSVEAPVDSLLPKSILNAFTRQIEKLSGESREALAIAALTEPSPEFDFNIWLTLLGGESQKERAQSVLEEAVERRLIRPLDNNRYVFRPADVVKALVSILPETRQRDLHRQIAEILIRRQADPMLVGHHYEQAGLTGEAGRYLEEAGTKATSTLAVNTAIAYYSRAVSLLESSSTLETLGELYRHKGDFVNSIQTLNRALKLAGQAGNVAEQAQILNGLAFTFWYYDRYEEAYQHAASVLKLNGISQAERAVAESHLGIASWLRGQFSDAESWCQQAVKDLSPSDGEARLAEAFYRLGLVYHSQGRLAEAHSTFQRALELHRKLENVRGQGHCLNSLGKIATDQGDFARVSSLFDSAQQRFHKANSRDGLMAVFTNRGRALLYQRRPNEALPLLTKAVHMARERSHRSAYILSNIYLLIAQVSLACSQVSRAKAIANDAFQLVEAAGNLEYVGLAQATLAQIYTAQGDQVAAKTAYQKALALFEQIDSRAELLRTKLNYAEFLAKWGQPDRAARLVQEARVGAAEIGLHLSHTE